jgi:hypothetical protein
VSAIAIPIAAAVHLGTNRSHSSSATATRIDKETASRLLSGFSAPLREQPDAQGVTVSLPAFGFDLDPIATQALPNEVDSNSPAFWDGDQVFVFTSAYFDDPGVFRSGGSSLLDLSDPVEVQMPALDRPGALWLESVWLDPSDHTLYGWYHFEPEDLECSTTPIIGAAVSYDDGLTWEDRGFVIESPYSVDCDYDNGSMAGGAGDFSVILDSNSQYFYFLFSNYGGPVEEQGIAVARSPFEARGQPGSLENYFEGDWSQPSLGGQATPVFPTTTGWKGPFIDAYWGPSVHWNTYLNSYVAVLNRTVGEQYAEEGVYIAFSQDLLHWSSPQKVLDGGQWYGEVLGLGPGESDSLAGKAMLFYDHGTAYDLLTFK